MPSNYAVVDEEKMAYTEGRGFFQSVAYGVVKHGINMAVEGLLGGGALGVVREVLRVVMVKLFYNIKS